jgi:uncharacterized protein with HEPN domain
MPPRDVLGLLQDVLDAAGFMQSRANGHNAATYLQNPDLQVIFERKFEVIGETLNQLAKRRRELFARVRHAQDAVDFRNVIIHAYSSVDPEIVWQIYQSTLTELVEDVEAIVRELEAR